MPRKHKMVTRANLQTTRDAQTNAEQACAHWDYESDGDGNHDCCRELRAAQDKHRANVKAYFAYEYAST